jgi:mannose-6-phosphate isomerase-like protein (cupin superfamily)
MLVSLLLVLTMAAPQAGRGAQTGRGSGRVAFAIAVSDPTGAPLSDVKVTMTGASERTSRTEAGRLVFENLPAGNYRFRFDKEGFISLEREVSARGTVPIDVKVTLTPAPPPPPAPAPVAAPPAPAPAAVDAKLVVLDMPAFVEKNYVGRAGGKTTSLGCSTGGSSTLIQINDAISTHSHADADEYLYVIAGQGSANMGDRHEPLGPGVYMLIPRGVEHGFTTGPKKPLVMISTRAGEKCAG